MLIHGRVLCDLCLAYMGHVYGQPADSSGWAAEFHMAPDYSVCPDCKALAEQEEDGAALTDTTQ